MPLFTYACQACGASFEALTKGEATTECPECGSTETAKGLSRFAPMSGASASPAAACDLGSMCCGGGCGAPFN
jgi:putative FmdB family regulatory protein